MESGQYKKGVTMNYDSIYDAIESDIINSQCSEDDKNKMLQSVMRLKEQKINIMITGATGCGKSSTINALFNIGKAKVEEIAKVGVGVAPETMDIAKYELDNLILWDTPGLGDGKDADEKHAKNIIKKLCKLDSNGKALIDLVIVILDGSTRDLGTSYELINRVIIPNLGDDKESRILVAINQADVAMKGRNWDYAKNEPQPILKEFLDKKVCSIKERIQETTGVQVEPIYYCAGFKQEGGEQARPYNLSKLLYYIVKATPSEKRIVYVDNINRDPQMWRDDDRYQEYGNECRNQFAMSIARVTGCVGSTVAGWKAGAGIGASIGSCFGPVGGAVGGFIGGCVGAVGGFLSSLF